MHPQIRLQVEGGNVLRGGCHRDEERASTASVHSLPWIKESPAIKSAAVVFLFWLFACRQQHIYWCFTGYEHSEQWRCGQGPGVQLSVAHGSAECGSVLWTCTEQAQGGGTAERGHGGAQGRCDSTVAKVL